MSARPVIRLREKAVQAAAAALPTGSAPAPVPEPSLRFWILWSPGARRPTRRHPTLEAALAESKRLAAKFPDRAFPVFQCQLVERET